MTARAFNISAEFGGNPGLTTWDKGAANQPVIQQQQANNTCVINFPPNTVLSHCAGTVTVKMPGEFLLLIIIDGAPIWTGEFLVGGPNGIPGEPKTWLIGFPIPATWRPSQVYLDFAYDNYTSASNPGAGVEYQLSFLAA